MDILIRNVDEHTVERLDSIVKNEKYGTRSELLNEIISLYVTSHHQFFTRALTPTVKFLSQEVLKEQMEYTQKSLNLIYNVNSDLLKKMDKIYAAFLPGLEENDSSDS